MASKWEDSPAAIFFNSLKDIKSGLPADINSDFEAIEKKLNDDKLQSLWSFPTSASISLLGFLNGALAECRILKLQRTSIKKKNFPFFRRSQRNTRQKIDLLVSNINAKIRDEESKADSSTWARTNFWTQHGDEAEADESTALLFPEEERKIINGLCGEGFKFKAIGIHGMCGSGKTVLVDRVLECPEVRKLFSPIIKIRLSNMSPKEHGDNSIVKYLLEVLGYDVDESIGKNRDVDPVDELKKKLIDRKFLIVLDDVWFYNDSLILKPGESDGYDNFLTRALPKDTGGAVIVTSRIKDVAQKIVGDQCLFHLKPWELEKGNCLEDVVRTKVSEGNNVEELVSHIHGLPLAAKTLANIVVE